jgi:hypothetical protein
LLLVRAHSYDWGGCLLGDQNIGSYGKLLWAEPVSCGPGSSS